jgi:hypothetical protein
MAIELFFHLIIGCEILMGSSALIHLLSSDEKFLAVNRSSGPCRVWDLQSYEVVASLPRETMCFFLERNTLV